MFNRTAKIERDLARSNEHVRNARHRIETQRDRVAQLEADGHSAQGAKELLEVMEKLLVPMEGYRNFEAAELVRSKRKIQ